MQGKESEDRRSLIVLGAFARTLAHRVRTPLSVISNDLQYFRRTLPEAEVERGISRCREISAILAEAPGTAALELNIRLVPLTEAAGLLVPHGKDFVFDQASGIKTDPPQLGQALRMAEECLMACSSGVKPEPDISADSMNLAVCYHFSLPESARCPQESCCLSEPLCLKLGMELPQAPLSDSILWALGCEMEFSGGNPCRYVVKIPICAQ